MSHSKKKSESPKWTTDNLGRHDPLACLPEPTDTNARLIYVINASKYAAYHKEDADLLSVSSQHSWTAKVLCVHPLKFYKRFEDFFTKNSLTPSSVNYCESGPWQILVSKTTFFHPNALQRTCVQVPLQLIFQAACSFVIVDSRAYHDVINIWYKITSGTNITKSTLFSWPNSFLKRTIDVHSKNTIPIPFEKKLWE